MGRIKVLAGVGFGRTEQFVCGRHRVVAHAWNSTSRCALREVIVCGSIGLTIVLYYVSIAWVVVCLYRLFWCVYVCA